MTLEKMGAGTRPAGTTAGTADDWLHGIEVRERGETGWAVFEDLLRDEPRPAGSAGLKGPAPGGPAGG